VHELSLARAIVSIVREHTNCSDPDYVARVNIRLGKSAGAVAGSLQLAFQALTAQGPLRRAALIIEEIPFCVHCFVCGMDSENADGVRICACCGKTDVEILSGTELEVSTIEMEEGDL
jgi:hydrogenase nickel incorporation protein HypA/HybF